MKPLYCYEQNAPHKTNGIASRSRKCDLEAMVRTMVIDECHNAEESKSLARRHDYGDLLVRSENHKNNQSTDVLALIKSPPLSFNTRTALAREQLTCAMTRSISFGSTPVSSTGPSSSGASKSGISSSSSSSPSPPSPEVSRPEAAPAPPPWASCCAADIWACEFISSI